MGAEIVEVKQLSNEQVAYKIRVNDDPTTDSWHTMNVWEEDHEAQLEEHKKVALKRHEALAKWREKWKEKLAGTGETGDK
jgi:hypothetical protein